MNRVRGSPAVADMPVGAVTAHALAGLVAAVGAHSAAGIAGLTITSSEHP